MLFSFLWKSQLNKHGITKQFADPHKQMPWPPRSVKHNMKIHGRTPGTFAV